MQKYDIYIKKSPSATLKGKNYLKNEKIITRMRTLSRMDDQS